MIVLVGSYQITVQRRPAADRSGLAAQEARRLQLERQVALDRERALAQHEQLRGPLGR